MERVVERELLDDLPPEDPGAVGSRRDIARLNRLMGHARILRRLLEPAMGEPGPRRIVELGAGDGTLTLRLAEILSPRWKEVELTLVDQREVVNHRTRAAFEALGWRVETATADVFDWLADAGEPADAMFANLFLHHFQADKLEELLRLAAARTRCFAACEPRRARLPLTLSRFAGLVGCNAVTRHRHRGQRSRRLRGPGTFHRCEPAHAALEPARGEQRFVFPFLSGVRGRGADSNRA